MLNNARPLTGISIVVTSANDTARLRRCFDAFADSWAEAHAQVIVVHSGAGSEIAALARQLSTHLWISTKQGTQESDLRRIGFERATRDIVLFVDARDSERCERVATLCRNWRAWSEAGGRVISAPIGAAEISNRPLYLSVVMPVRNGGPSFLLALQALTLSDLPRHAWELVVVDDGSTDETAAVGAQYADKLLRIRPGPRGPGYARNRGFELTLGECVAFVNADVMVETDALRNGVTLLAEHPELGAVFGSCCTSPTIHGFLSDYRSLIRRHYHESNADDACVFCSACGVVRSSVFERAGGYDEWHFSRRQLEDLELGQRIRSLGERIAPAAGIRATDLRRWTIHRMIATEILDRAVPWMRLVKRALLSNAGGSHPRQRGKRLRVGLTWLAAICAVLAWTQHSVPLGTAAIAGITAVLVSNRSQLGFFIRERGFGFAALSVPVDVLYYMIAGIGVACGWIARLAFGEPTPGAVAEAYAEMGRKRWPPVPVKRIVRPSIASKTESTTPYADSAGVPLVAPESMSGGSSSDGSSIVQ